jgi:type II secretory pathway predicted ATPase ExeA
MLETTRAFFGLPGQLFSRPPAEPYLDPGRQRALTQLQNLVGRRGLAALTGPPGSGKTALLHYLCATLNDNHHRVAYVPFSFLEKGQLVHYLAARLGLAPRRGIAAGLRAVQEHLHSLQPVNPVIILDEAERLEINTAHILRCLVHDRADTAHHCTLILAGTEALVDQTLRLQVHEPLRQRITLYVRLGALNREHTGDYIAHHLRCAGSSGELFQPQAVELIHELVNGLPRLVGSLAEAAIDNAAAARHQTVTVEHVSAAAETVLPPHFTQAGP